MRTHRPKGGAVSKRESFTMYQDKFQLQKPPISEMFAAVSGIVFAGITVTQNPTEKTRPLSELAMEAAAIPYDSKLRLYEKPLEAEKVAARICDFLVKAKPVLSEYANIPLSSTKGQLGGILLDVLAHIKDIEARESNGIMDRVREEFTPGKRHVKFRASYLPVAAASESAAPVEWEKSPEESRRKRGGSPKVRQSTPVLL